MFKKIPSDALHISMADSDNPLATYTKYPFSLEGLDWPSVEHYINAMKFVDAGYQEKIRLAKHPSLAHKMGKSWWQKKRPDWKKVRDTLMVRAVYTKCKTYPSVSEALLETGDRYILETSKYDYYWGCGRDTRGLNKYGHALMAVRDRLRQEQTAESSDTPNEKSG